MSEELSNDDAGKIRNPRKRETRGSRLSDTWNATNIHEAKDRPWVQSRALPQIPPRKGMAQRWIRVAMYGTEDPNNVSRKLRNGWKPRDPATVPKGVDVPSISHGEWAGCIGIEGSVLCEMPIELANQFRKANAEKNKHQNDGIKRMLQSEERPYTHISQERNTEEGFARVMKAAADSDE